MNRLNVYVQFFKLFLDCLRTYRKSSALNDLAKIKLKVISKPAFLGGPASKVEHLKEILANVGEKYSGIFILSSVRVPLFFIRVLKWLKIPVIVNQNGVYYPAWFSGDYKKSNLYLKKINELADFCFFQSSFAEKSYEKWVGDLPAHRKILYNPVDLNVFFPIEKSLKKKKKILIFNDVSEFTKKNWEYFLSVIEQKKDFFIQGFEFIFLGRIIDEQVYSLLNFENLTRNSEVKIQLSWNLKRSLIPGVIRECDFLIHLIYNDVCPNKVLECLASGLPVICSSAGGTKELIMNAGIVLKVEEAYEQHQFPDVEELIKAVQIINSNYDEYRAQSIQQAKKFDLKKWHKETLRVLHQ